MQRSIHLQLAKVYWKKLLSPGDLAIDATAGNGKDALFLAELGCLLFALDVQATAIEKTQALLREKGVLDRATLLCMPHDDLRKVPCPKPPRLVVYNLGYLPGGDKSLTTKTVTTLASIASALKILAPDGALSITCYPGHPEGKREEEALFRWAASLSPDDWAVRIHRQEDRPLAPSLLWIARSKNA